MVSTVYIHIERLDRGPLAYCCSLVAGNDISLHFDNFNLNQGLTGDGGARKEYNRKAGTLLATNPYLRSPIFKSFLIHSPN
jgi:hypothetical protein